MQRTTEGSPWVDAEQLAALLEGNGTATPVSAETRRVVLTLANGEELEIGRVDSRESAIALARAIIDDIEGSSDRDEWPTVGDRHLRPLAIVSVDVQRAV